MRNPLKGLFGGKPTQKETPAEKDIQTVHEQKAAPVTPGFRFIGGQLVPYDTNKDTYVEKGYRMNHMLYSVIKLIVDKAKVAPMAVYTVQDERKYFEYQSLQKQLMAGEGTGKDFMKMRDLRHKSLKLDTTDTYLLDRLTESPNDSNQTMQMLNEALMTFYLLTGDYFEAGWTPLSGGLNKGKPSQFYELPSQWVWIVANRTLPITEAGYELTLAGRQSFTAEDVSHCKMFNPHWDTVGSQLYGMSPVEAGAMLLQASNLGTTREAKSMENAGADVVVYADDPETTRSFQDFTIEQMGLMKERWNAEQAGYMNAGKAVWSPSKVGVARLGVTPEQLGMLPAGVQNLRWFCNLYNVPSQLMNDPENKTFSNQKEGQLALLYNAVLPLLNTREKMFTKSLRRCPAYKGSRKVVEFDRSVYGELETDKGQLWNWLKDAPFNTETKYQYLDQEVPADMPEHIRKAILIPSGYQLMDDLFLEQDDLTGTVNALNATGNNPYQLPIS